MTESPRTSVGPPESAVDAMSERQDRWRSGTASTARSSSRTASRRVAAGAALALSALAALMLSTALVVAPLFSWQTACVTLIVDT